MPDHVAFEPQRQILLWPNYPSFSPFRFTSHFCFDGQITTLSYGATLEFSVAGRSTANRTTTSLKKQRLLFCQCSQPELSPWLANTPPDRDPQEGLLPWFFRFPAKKTGCPSPRQSGTFSQRYFVAHNSWAKTKQAVKDDPPKACTYDWYHGLQSWHDLPFIDQDLVSLVGFSLYFILTWSTDTHKRVPSRSPRILPQGLDIGLS
jgi:hypothetical protein